MTTDAANAAAAALYLSSDVAQHPALFKRSSVLTYTNYDYGAYVKFAFAESTIAALRTECQ